MSYSQTSGAYSIYGRRSDRVANTLGYPVLVRPSYVLGGQGMQIAINDEDVDRYIGIINRIAQKHPILVDKYLQGKEIEVDAICDGQDILIPGMRGAYRARGYPFRGQYFGISGTHASVRRPRRPSRSTPGGWQNPCMLSV